MHDSSPSGDSGEGNYPYWPEIVPPRRIPTPYEIFGLEKSSPYSKHRFYELVKHYHPDRKGSYLENSAGISDVNCTISESVRLERYRLIVAAHTILSDPVKRSAYDRYGAGWNGQAEFSGPRFRHDSVSRRPSSKFRFGDDPVNNATWEDWERWYRRQESSAHEPPSQQNPVYISNIAFAALVVMLAGLGGIGQATRVEAFSNSFLEQRDRRHDIASKDLMKVRQETKEKPRDQRIHRFLEEREPGWHEREEAYRKLLPSPEVCSSEHVKEKGKQIYRTVPPPRSRPPEGVVGEG